MNTQLSTIVEQSGVEKTKAQSVLEQFSEFFEKASEWEQKTKSLVITNASQKEEMKLARNARLRLRDIRVAADKKKKELKEGIIVEGRLIDGIYNIIVGITKPLEASLLEKEKWVERQEENRKEALRSERAEKLEPYDVDSTFYDLANMTNEAFEQLLENSRLAQEARIEAQRKAEEERIAREKAAAEERAMAAAEVAKLKAEAEAREKELAAERAKIEAERAEYEKAARKDREAREAAERAEREKQEAAIRKARQEAERAQYELRMKEEAEERAKREEAARIEAQRKAEEEERKRLEAAGDKEKLSAYFDQVLSLEVPTVKSGEATGILAFIHNCIHVCVSKIEKL
jgi:colicin import membrane protein